MNTNEPDCISGYYLLNIQYEYTKYKDMVYETYYYLIDKNGYIDHSIPPMSLDSAMIKISKQEYKEFIIGLVLNGVDQGAQSLDDLISRRRMLKVNGNREMYDELYISNQSI